MFIVCNRFSLLNTKERLLNFLHKMTLSGKIDMEPNTIGRREKIKMKVLFKAFCNVMQRDTWLNPSLEFLLENQISLKTANLKYAKNMTIIFRLTLINI